MIMTVFVISTRSVYSCMYTVNNTWSSEICNFVCPSANWRFYDTVTCICDHIAILPNQLAVLRYSRTFVSNLFQSTGFRYYDFSFTINYCKLKIYLIMFGPYGPNMLESQSNFLHLIIIIIFLSPRLQRQFTSNLLQTSAQWSLGIHLPDETFFSFIAIVDLDLIQIS